MNSATKVGEIFTAAGEAFSRLGDMAMLLNSSIDQNSGKSSKWTNEEIDMLRTSIQTFANDLDKISEHIKNRTISQIKQTLKKKAFDEANIVEQPKFTPVSNEFVNPVQPHTEAEVNIPVHVEMKPQQLIIPNALPVTIQNDQEAGENIIVKEENNI